MSSSLPRILSVRNLTFVAIAAVLALAAAGLAGPGSAGASAIAPEDRPAAPTFSVTTLDGAPWTLEQQRGRVVLLNFFATWCPPCRAEMPDLVSIAADYRAKGVATLGLSLDEGGTAVVKPFLARYKVDFPVALAQPGSAITAGITGIPVTMILDRSGRVARHYVGMISADQVRQDLDALLAE